MRSANVLQLWVRNFVFPIGWRCGMELLQHDELPRSNSLATADFKKTENFVEWPEPGVESDRRSEGFLCSRIISQ